VRHGTAGVPVQVLSPPIDVDRYRPRAKRPVILSVGRFFAVGHTKRHDLMVEAFRRLCDAGLDGWQLHLAGSVHREAHNVGYYERVEELARGYPVHLHPDASYERVQDLYARASIYWHAAGYGVDAAREPINLEHFGMTTAEAMGHGAVPVVIARGGQPEVVRDGVDGYLWEEPAELEERTLQLVRDANARRRMGESARDASQRFSRAEFKRRMVKAVAPVVAELVPVAGEDQAVAG
jgi:glycosyltransferase involved in cell wall biosynthesis